MGRHPEVSESHIPIQRDSRNFASRDRRLPSSSPNNLAQNTAQTHGGASGTSHTVWIAIAILSAMGPYLGAGLRTEQVAVYAAAALLTLRHLHATDARTLRLTRPISLAWMMYVACCLIATAIPPIQRGLNFQPGNITANLDNILVPTAVLLIVRTIPSSAATRIQHTATSATVVVAAINTAAAILQAFYGQSYPRWWSAGLGESVAQLASQSGRYSGLLNQPSEAGVLYSLGLLSTVWLFAKRPWALLPLAALISLGGFMSVSKIFLFVGVPLAALQYTRTGRNGLQQVVQTVGLAAILVALSPTMAAMKIPGMDQFDRIVQMILGDAVTGLTGGRFSSAGSSFGPLVQDTINHSPLLGYGLEGVSASIDNALVEALVFAGLIGVGALIVFYGVLLVSGFRTTTTKSPQRPLLQSITALIVVSSVGIPTLTVNRVGSIALILFLTTLIAAHTSPAVNDHERIAQ